MTNEAQNSQANTANLGSATAYAYKLSRTNSNFVSLKLWAFGGISASENIAVENIPARLDEIDLGLADGEPFVNIRELSFAVSEKLLREIRAELKNFAHNTGGSGSQVPEVEARANRVAESQEPAPAEMPGREVSPVSEMGNNNGRGSFASLRRVKSCAPSLGAQGVSNLRCGGENEANRPDSKEACQASPEADGATASGTLSPQEALKAAQEQLARNIARRLETLIRVLSSPE